MIHQFNELQANKMAQEKIFKNPKVDFIWSHEARKFERIGERMKIELEDLKSHEHKSIETDGVFIFVGMKPNLELFKDNLEKDTWGYIVTNEDKRTNIDGVYAVGDVTSKKYRQITTAIADGTVAAIAITKEMDAA
ncbi:MAG: FAD-dependent oxidoreductase [Bacteroidales bacterium]|nr:FAD-dependent oxidoreductase [Bacteroidales bacterium]